MDQKEFTVESEIRLEEQLTELIEKYGAENVRQTLLKLISNLVADKVEGANPNKAITTNATPVAQKRVGTVTVDDKNEKKLNARPNITNFNDFIMGLHQIQSSGKAEISKPIVDYLNNFLGNAKLILDGKNKEVNESFYMGLATRTNFDLKNEDEEWIMYNLEIIVKQLKSKLRHIGYVFLDNDAEVGQIFNPKIHNCVKYDYTDEKFKDNRITRVVDEGIVIEGFLHINANVIVGKYK